MIPTQHVREVSIANTPRGTIASLLTIPKRLVHDDRLGKLAYAGL